jgi:hypothetical protein
MDALLAFLGAIGSSAERRGRHDVLASGKGHD